ncbi:MAG: Motility protein [Pseudomonadota bacterium]
MAEAVLEAPTDEAKALEAEAPVADGVAEAEADAAPLIPEEAAVDAPVVVAPSITIKKIMDDGHGGAHGGAWKIALADMMTAMMAFFLLMWLLGASNADQRKSIADYFKPTSHSNVTMGKLAGSDGMLGGRSVSVHKAAPQKTILLPMARTAKSLGKMAIQVKNLPLLPLLPQQLQTLPTLRRWKKRSKRPWRRTLGWTNSKIKLHLHATQMACELKSSTRPTSPCLVWVPPP